MELIDKKKMYKEIKQVEQKYHKLCCDDMEMSTYRLYQRILADLENIRSCVENEEADIIITAAGKIGTVTEECIQCNSPVDTPFSICDKCREEAAQQRDEYIQYCMKEASKNEK